MAQNSGGRGWENQALFDFDGYVLNSTLHTWRLQMQHRDRPVDGSYETFIAECVFDGVTQGGDENRKVANIGS